MSTDTLEAGTYEVLRNRLQAQARALAAAAAAVNEERLAVFGGAELRLLGTERIRTDNNCVPRDIVSLGDVMLFGYNVFIGLRPETAVSDVFSVHRFVRQGEAFTFEAGRLDALDDPAFRKDFAELYRYYKETRLQQLRRVEGRLLAVFGTGTGDTRVLRWAAGADGTVRYLDNQGERDHVFPPSHEFAWTPATRDDHVPGRHPHISIRGEVFVETVGGDLTIKVENNTETGEGVYSEPVDEPLQSLADADVEHAAVGPLILMRIRPYKEETWRHLVFNTRTKAVTRLDGIGQSCRLLPEDQGLIFPGGYYLTTGVSKTFDTDVADLEFERVVRSPNGEDVLYVFHARGDGRSLLLPYNVIRKEVATPLVCHGYSLFDDGTMVVFRATSDEPARVHPMQVWQTPYVSDTYAAAQPAGTGPLERIGNAELVRGISDCLSVARMVEEMAPSAATFEALIAACTRALDSYHWLGGHGLGGPLADVRATAEQVLDEYENVEQLTRQAADRLAGAAEDVTRLVREARAGAPATADGWVSALAGLRRAQGRLVTLREVRYMDLAALDALEATLAGELADTGRRAVAFLEGPDAFSAYRAAVEELAAEAAAIGTTAEARPVADRLSEQAEGLEVVTEVVGSLDIADPTVRTSILGRIAEVLGGVNRARAVLDGRRRELLGEEGRAAFAAEFALLGQAVTGALAVADTPGRCDEQLGRLMLQVENLESRFGEYDDFAAQLAARRDEVYEAFSARKQAQLDALARRADRVFASAERVLGNVARRAGALASLDEVNAYFAGDPMVARVGAAAAELRGLGDAVRAEELDGRLKAARQEAGRALRDRLDLFSDGGEVIRLGRHRFAVNTQPIDLTLVPHQGEMHVAITGTDYRAPAPASFADTRPFWDQLLVSEIPEVYRCEHLAACLLDAVVPGPPARDDLARLVREAVESRYDEGYERGVHDHDTLAVLEALVRLRDGAGLLRYPPSARAAAQLFWTFGADDVSRKTSATRASSLVRARAVLGAPPALAALAEELGGRIAAFLDGVGAPPVDASLAGEYLVEELGGEPHGFVTAKAARDVLDRFRAALGPERAAAFDADLAALPLPERLQLAHAWIGAFHDGPDVAEAVAVQLCDLPRHDSAAALTETVDGLLGTHPRVVDRRLELRLDEFLSRTRAFRTERVPAYRAYQRRRAELVETERARLRLDEYRPKVMSAFVRNRLLDEVYLPLIGDNLAKQLGAAGADRRTDQMGLLLLISPPGYGKTTLMEYVAGRLGLVLVKVNGPALGHRVTSLDPAQAPDAAARQEVEKISFALEAGNNVLLYLDDIQHTSPELLEKFVSLCDAQRRIEGVWNGRTRTYDLRGKRFAVCMAGNPYTESGSRFRVPDMLANRADVWNLGDVLSGRDELFALSYIDNALTSNPVLAPLSARDRGDVELLVRLAKGDPSVRPDQLGHPYAKAELEQVLSVLGKLARVQEVVLGSNRAYIASAAQSDAARTEPPYRLQGSYRNMNKLAERIVPAMNDDELEALIDDHYLGEAQTLTSDAEANLLKLAELRGRLTPAQAERWAEVKAAYLRDKALGGPADDPVTRAVGAIGLLADRVREAGSEVGSAIRDR
ncbi:DNA repair ATPase [Nonomuraea pusilla]|uniref:ATPase family associated with various cellular activities (AAA) n=1 Tax=Nonomuraea pusilla TaxID=46177 RepID=A0A1H8DDX1_9ACTN|nr:DNA repair ATPase [Nonomuraea pusilla]SEN04748.1 ATPase family associated with various cellular activities (AAA) [Nonomuraea pusilla]